MMSAIFLLLSLMPFMVSTTSATTCAALDGHGRWRSSPTGWPVRALSAFWRTVEPSSSIEAAVSSSAPKPVARCAHDRSLLPEAISALAVATPSALWRTLPTMVARRDCMVARACSNWPVSSLRVVAMGWVRSPSAMLSAACLAQLHGPHDGARDGEGPAARPAPPQSACPRPATPGWPWPGCRCLLWLAASCVAMAVRRSSRLLKVLVRQGAQVLVHQRGHVGLAAAVQLADLGELVAVGFARAVGNRLPAVHLVLLALHQCPRCA